MVVIRMRKFHGPRVVRHPLAQPVNEGLRPIQRLTGIVINEIRAHVFWPCIEVAALPEIMQPREHQLLVDLCEAVEAGDQEVFAEKLFLFDQMSKLDKWKTTICLRIKNAIEEKGEDFS